MSIFYSKSTGGFYNTEINSNMPADVVEISDQLHKELLMGQIKGKIISASDAGLPMLMDLPEVTKDQIIEVMKIARANAYRNEADPLFFKSQLGEATDEEWKAKREEIKTRYPYPA